MLKKFWDGIKIALIIIAMCAAVFGLIWYEYSMWSECRGHDTFFYCMRVLSK